MALLDMKPWRLRVVPSAARGKRSSLQRVVSELTFEKLATVNQNENAQACVLICASSKTALPKFTQIQPVNRCGVTHLSFENRKTINCCLTCR